MILGIDVGNYSLKTSSNISVKSLVSTEENILGSKLILEYDNQKFIIGEGNFETELNKSTKENFLPLLYTGIALSSEDTFNQIVNRDINNRIYDLKKEAATINDAKRKSEIFQEIIDLKAKRKGVS